MLGKKVLTNEYCLLYIFRYKTWKYHTSFFYLNFIIGAPLVVTTAVSVVLAVVLFISCGIIRYYCSKENKHDKEMVELKQQGNWFLCTYFSIHIYSIKLYSYQYNENKFCQFLLDFYKSRVSFVAN